MTIFVLTAVSFYIGGAVFCWWTAYIRSAHRGYVRTVSDFYDGLWPVINWLVGVGHLIGMVTTPLKKKPWFRSAFLDMP